MDPVTLIVSALATGAVAGLKETAGTVVKDAYNRFKALMQRKFAEKPDAQLILAKYEQKPEVWQAPLEEEVRQSGLAQDEELLTAAKQLLELLQSHQAAGKYNIQITGNIQGLAQGDHQQVMMHFGPPPEVS